MPIVRRTIIADVESLLGKQEVHVELYVKPSQIEKGDVVLEPKDLPEAMLADLAITHPKEFKKAALAAGVVQFADETDEDDDAGIDHDEDEVTFTKAQLDFLTMKAGDAVTLIEQAAAGQDVDTLAAYAIAEEANDHPRKSVLEALQKAVG
jgi:hypothetical protein